VKGEGTSQRTLNTFPAVGQKKLNIAKSQFRNLSFGQLNIATSQKILFLLLLYHAINWSSAHGDD
jgi:hypothetical protein